jgi:hypothetical protein
VIVYLAIIYIAAVAVSLVGLLSISLDDIILNIIFLVILMTINRLLPITISSVDILVSFCIYVILSIFCFFLGIIVLEWSLELAEVLAAPMNYTGYYPKGADVPGPVGIGIWSVSIVGAALLCALVNMTTIRVKKVEVPDRDYGDSAPN